MTKLRKYVTVLHSVQCGGTPQVLYMAQTTVDSNLNVKFLNYGQNI